MANDDIIVKYGTNQQLESVGGLMPFYDNSDDTKYIESDGVKIYNSAILKNSNKAYWILLFDSAESVINQYSSSARPQTSYNKQGNNCYSRYNQYQPSQVFQKTTLGGVEIYFNDSENSDSTALSEAKIPTFTNDPQAFRDYITNPTVSAITSNGGGATHIAKVIGQLKDLSSNLSDILMVSGGGGGGLLVGDTDYSGKEAGGISGSGDNSADQSTGNAFGQGESGTNVSGGGSGLYGGYKGTSAKSGGAGSGYIGNSLLSNKKMVGYNVPTSSAEGTKTESVNEVNASAVSGKPKSGNGFAKIKFLKRLRDIEFLSVLKTQDLEHMKTANNLGWYGGGVPTQLSQYLDSDWILGCGVHSGIAYLEQSGEEYILDGSQGHDTYMLYPIRNDLIGKRISKVNIKALLYDTEGYSNSVFSNIIIINGNDSDEYYSIQAFNYNAGTTADRTIFALNTWYSFSVNMNNVILPDYIQIYVAVGKWKFKDIVFDVEE